MLNTETEGNMRIRFRSARRDESSDAKRLGSIERSIRNAISDVESDKDGLARRLKDARDRAAVHVGSDASEYLDRETSVEQELSASERELVSAPKRVRRFNSHLEHFYRVSDVLKQK